MIMSRSIQVLLAVAALATGGIARAAEPATAASAKPDISVKPNLQQLISQFKTRRDVVLADREALIAQLKNATEDQRKTILEKMEAQQKDLIEAERALGKQIRDELRKLPQSSTTSPRH